jgi:hypothetical protein
LPGAKWDSRWNKKKWFIVFYLRYCVYYTAEPLHTAIYLKSKNSHRTPFTLLSTALGMVFVLCGVLKTAGTGTG